MAESVAFVLFVAGLAVLLIATFPVVSRVNLIALGLFLIFLSILITQAMAGVYDGWPAVGQRW